MAATNPTVIDSRELWDGINHAWKKDHVHLDAYTVERILCAVVEALEPGDTSFEDIVPEQIRRFAPNARGKRYAAYFHAVGKALNTRRQRIGLELLKEEAWQTIFKERRQQLPDEYPDPANDPDYELVPYAA